MTKYKKDKNIYRYSRQSYICENGKCLTIEKAAESLFIDTKTLISYEMGKTKPTPLIVCSMSHLYNDPVLRRLYCTKECEIGELDQVYSKPRSLYSSGYKLIEASKKIEDVRNRLFDILSDGKVTDDEVKVLNTEITDHIKEVKKILNEIEIEIERKGYLTDLSS